MKRINTDHSRIKIDIRFQKTSQRLRRYVPTTRNRDVRMPGAQIGFEPGGYCGVVYSFVQLEQMRMSPTNTDPKYFWPAFRRKRPSTNNRQKKSAELNCTQLFTKCWIDFFRNIAKETKGEMHLHGIEPAHSLNLWVKIDKKLSR